MVIKAKVPITVRYSETDQMGVAYHANYFTWFNVARDKLMKEVGIEIKHGESLGYLFPVKEISCDYLYPARYDDDLTVIATTEPGRVAKMEVDYKVINAKNNRLLARGSSVNVLTDENGQILFRLPEELKQELDWEEAKEQENE